MGEWAELSARLGEFLTLRSGRVHRIRVVGGGGQPERRRLDEALEEGGGKVMALRPGDLAPASPGEKARLIGHLLDGFTSDAEEEWILERLSGDRAEGAAILERLVHQGRLDQLFGDFDGAGYRRLMRITRRLVPAPELAAEVALAIGQGDGKVDRLGLHKLFDVARRRGFLDATLALLDGRGSETVAEVAAASRADRRPAIIAHRGLPTEFPENTMPAFRAAVAAGADGLEIDITVTADDRIVVWHDYDPGKLVPIIRNLGLEGGMGFRPRIPDVGHPARRPVYELELATLRRHFGYAPREGGITNRERTDVEIPTFEEFSGWAASTPRLQTIILDVKLPPDEPAVQDRFARALLPTLRRSGLADRVILLHNTARVVRRLKRKLGADYAYSHDIEIVSAAPSAARYSAVQAALDLGNEVASVGRPRVGIRAYPTYLDVLRNDRQQLESSGRDIRLITWTLNDELELRDVIAIGVDGILTDDPALLAELVEAYQL